MKTRKMVGLVDLAELTDAQLKRVSDQMKINGQQILDFDKMIAKEVNRRRNGIR